MDDKIDFRVSDTWRDHYAAQGLTSPSGREERRIAKAIESVDHSLMKLGEIIKTLRDNPPRPRAGPTTPPTPSDPPYSGIDPLSP